ncbi:MAG TPA: hypothetical protein VN723_08170 [Rhizomicrobium sp.]|nr:hypothetical protein [Rhizomicrobium sp.]
MDFTRAAYERNLLSTFARLAGKRAPGVSDDDRDREYRAQEIFYAALARFEGAVKEAHPLTALRADALTDLLAALADGTPDRARWTHAITEAIHGE